MLSKRLALMIIISVLVIIAAGLIVFRQGNHPINPHVNPRENALSKKTTLNHQPELNPTMAKRSTVTEGGNKADADLVTDEIPDIADDEIIDEIIADDEIIDEIIDEIMTQDNYTPENTDFLVSSAEQSGDKASKKTKTFIVDGVPYEVKEGEPLTLTIVKHGVGTYNPRPRTKEENEEYQAIIAELRLKPPGERREELLYELNKINAETTYPPVLTETLTLTALPDDGNH